MATAAREAQVPNSVGTVQRLPSNVTPSRCNHKLPNFGRCWVPRVCILCGTSCLAPYVQRVCDARRNSHWDLLQHTTIGGLRTPVHLGFPAPRIPLFASRILPAIPYSTPAKRQTLTPFVDSPETSINVASAPSVKFDASINKDSGHEPIPLKLERLGPPTSGF